MTIKQWIKNRLFQSGLFENQYETIIELCILDEESIFPNMERRWEDNIENYPSQLLAVLWVGVKHYTLKYIDSNIPEAWFRPLFCGVLGEAGHEKDK